MRAAKTGSIFVWSVGTKQCNTQLQSDKTMSITEQIEKMKTEVIAASIADKVVQQLKEQWRTVVDELVSHRKRSEQLSQIIEKLEAKVNTLKSYVDTAQTQIRANVEAQRKAAKLLDIALEDLGVEE